MKGPAQDDTKPPLKDPVSNLSLSIACAHTENHSLEHILRSDPIETEEAVLKLPPFPFCKSK
ncbi:hypothetical protein SADUNF_Sadunf01G0008200 [Salix dunnii]|uniref:Uncharacterized protein n=1 Tax=Salix dunnii TaxID=1413687 RepID=A0A835N9A2_9ROSI|nr:hypothetical protein SADUNF_Sadunf01G0008200 [Salix dunnii]